MTVRRCCSRVGLAVTRSQRQLAGGRRFHAAAAGERQRFAASPLQAVGTAQVHQPASRMDRLLFGVARNFDSLATT